MLSDSPGFTNLKELLEQIKEVAAAIHGEKKADEKEAEKKSETPAKAAEEKPEEKEIAPRSSPLQIVGRLYLGLTTIVAVSAGTAAYFDTKAMATTEAAASYLRLPESINIEKVVASSTHCLRYAVILAVLLGLVSCIVLVYSLVSKHPMYLSSPTELTSTAHARFVGDDPEEKTSETGDEPLHPKKKRGHKS